MKRRRFNKNLLGMPAGLKSKARPQVVPKRGKMTHVISGNIEACGKLASLNHMREVVGYHRKLFTPMVGEANVEGVVLSPIQKEMKSLLEMHHG